MTHTASPVRFKGYSDLHTHTFIHAHKCSNISTIHYQTQTHTQTLIYAHKTTPKQGDKQIWTNKQQGTKKTCIAQYSECLISMTFVCYTRSNTVNSQILQNKNSK